VAKSIKKELKRPDEFVSFWTRFGQSASEVIKARRRAFVIGATALATVIVGSILFSEMAERKAIRSSHTLDRVDRIMNGDLVPEGGTAKDDGIPHFKTDKERAEGALKELDAFAAAEPHSSLRSEAALMRGQLLLKLDRADEAIALYEPLVRSVDGRLRFLADEGLGYAFERKGDLDRALASFSKLGEDAAGLPGFYRDRALYQQARIAEVRGNPGDAAKLYHEVLDKNPTTSLRDEISNRLAALELK
jgi:tetratricopeptide (TPR) repeat protein